jgi:hypothetical protein
VHRPVIRYGILVGEEFQPRKEEIVAKPAPEGRVDPTWPDLPDGEHPVSELASPVQGSLSPFGDLEFPLDTVPYEHPVTKINK